LLRGTPYGRHGIARRCSGKGHENNDARLIRAGWSTTATGEAKADSTGRRNTLTLAVYMTTGKRKSEQSVGSVGDAYDNALAETINGLYKTEVIRRRSSWKTMNEVELETLKWVDWFNNRRLQQRRPSKQT
jgi:transposase InsO family protein